MKNIKVVIGRTNRALANQGYTYNEPGLTYNNEPSWDRILYGSHAELSGSSIYGGTALQSLAVMYGGLYGNDIYPIIARSREIRPMNMRSGDIGITAIPVVPRTLGRGMLSGMFVGLTYPEDIVVQ